MNKDLSKLTIKSLKILASENNINLKGKTKKIDIINKINYDLYGSNQKEIFEKIKEQYTLQNEEEKIKEEKIIACAKYEERYIVIVPIPELYKKLKPYLTSYCSNIAFYLSTGTSNSSNFPGIWLPFVNVASNGWIRKEMGGFDSYVENFIQYSNPEIFEQIKSKFVLAFISRFSEWFLLQISAGLPSDPDSLWNKDPKFAFLKGYLLSKHYNKRERKFLPNDSVNEYPIVGRYILPDTCDNLLNSPEEVNKFLLEYDAYCYPKNKTNDSG